MLAHLTTQEARIIGCLMEKSVVTSDQCPLTLNALTNACNQKSARDPVMSLTPGEVQHTARDLKNKSLVHIDENSRTGMEKYKQRFCNTTFNALQFDPPQFAIICLLLLRGPQTPGELRANSGRLHSFADNDAVVDALTGLIDNETDPFVVKLPRTPGRKDAEYMHLFCGPVDIAAHLSHATTADRVSVSDLISRIRELEAEVAELRARLAERQ